MTRLAKFALAWLVALGCVSAAAALAADEKIDVAGTWNVEIEIAGQQGTPVFTFKQEGGKLTGTYKGQFGEAPVTGKIEGKDIEFSFETQGVKIVYTGTVDKDTMKGKLVIEGFGEGTFTAKKQ